MLLYLLSSSRFDVTMVSSDGSTPLHYFIRSFPDSPSAEESVKFTEAVQALIDNGVNIRATNKNGETVLHRASMSGKAAALRWLVKMETWAIDINATTNYGDSALHLAARVGAIDTVRTLLDLGIDTSLKSQHGTALDVAKRAKHREVVCLLEEWTHDPSACSSFNLSNVRDMVEGIFRSAYQKAKTDSGEPRDAGEADELATSSSSADLLSLSTVESNPSSLKSSQNDTSEPPSLDSSASCVDQSAIESILASLSWAPSKDDSTEATSLEPSLSDQSEPPSLHSSPNQLDTISSVVDCLMSSIFGS